MDTYFAVLMLKKKLEEGIFYFYPQSMIEGTINGEDDEIYFQDTIGNEYLIINNSGLAFSNLEIGVGFLISENDLLNKYPDSSIYEAKARYFDEICHASHFGYYIENEDAIEIMSINLYELLANLQNIQNNNIIDSDVKIDETSKLNQDKRLNQSEEIEYVVLQRDVFRSLLNSKNFGELMAQLQLIEKEININEQSNNLENQDSLKTKVYQINVREMKEYFDNFIIGQEEAKKDIISTIFMNQFNDKKNSCLLVGPTGSGKTLIAETASQYLQVPIEIVNTTQITMPGYKGADIEDSLLQLLIKAGGDLEKAENGIIVFDEIDKKGISDEDNISGKGVLNTLLPFFQGTVYNLNYYGKTIQFDTSRLTIFATGAFTNVIERKNVNNSYKNSNIGFNSVLENKEENIYTNLVPEDFVKYGNMPIELMGRFTTISQLSPHNKESLKNILTKSLNSPLLLAQATLLKININLVWNDDFIDATVEKAIYLKTGARALRSIVEYAIKVARWEVITNLSEYKTICLTKNTPYDNTDCILINKDGVLISLKEKNLENSPNTLIRKLV